MNKKVKGRLIFATTVILALMSLLAWGFSSPPSSSPDDNYHMASIWCGLGDRESLCQSSPDDENVKLVPSAAYSSTCYTYNPDESAACLESLFGESGKKLIETESTNASGGYPPMFYAAMGTLASTDVWASTALIRILNSLIFVVVVALLWLLLPLHRRGTLTWAILVSVVPLGMFIIPSTNPSSWAILSAGTLWLALLGWHESTGRRKWLLGSLALVACIMGSGARADAAIFSVISIIIAQVLATGQRPFRLRNQIFPLSLALISVFFFLTSAQGEVVNSGLSNTTGPPHVSTPLLILGNAIMVPSLWFGVFGGWELGWLDTALPVIVPIAAFGTFAALAFFGVGQKSATRAFAWKKILSASALFAALWVFPIYILVKTGASTGAYVQPRYILPLLIIFAGILLVTESGLSVQLTNIQTTVAVTSLTIANSISLFWNTRRYTTGADVTNWNLDERVEWWWSGIPSPMVNWVVGSIAFAGMLMLISASLKKNFLHVRAPGGTLDAL